MGSGILKTCRKLFAYTLLGSGILSIAFLFVGTPVHAAAGINQEINFQGRLLNAQGAVVPDGYYNIEFKIYQDGDGTHTGDSSGSPTGQLQWTEDYVDNNASAGVQVVNGYLSVQLGSICPLSGSTCQGHTNTGVNWDSDTLWLSMNVAGSNNTCTTFNSGTCIADGEMLPMKRLSSSAYALNSLNSQELGGVVSGDFVQFADNQLQTDATTYNSIYINKTGSGNILDLQTSGVDTFIINSSGNQVFGANAAHSISIATAAASTAGVALSITGGAAGTGGTALAGGSVTITGGAGGGTNGNGGNLVLDAGAPNGTGAGGTISLGTTNASAVTIGNTSGSTAVNVNSGTGSVNLNENANNTTNINAGTSTGAVSIGNSAAGNISTTTSSAHTIAQTSGATSQTLATGGDTIKTSTNSSTAFVVQNTSTYQVFTVDTSGSQVVLGKASQVNGQIIFQSSGGGTYVGFSAPTTAPGTSYVLALPTAAPTASSQCLQSSGTFTQLVFSTCAAVGSYINNAFGTTQAGNFNIQGTSSTVTTAVIEANNGGSGDILDLLNGASTPVATFDKNGNLVDSATGTSSFAGTLVVTTKVETPTLDTASSVPLNIGSSSSQININQNEQVTGNTTYASGANRQVIVASNASGSGYSLTLQGGAAGTGNNNGGNLVLQGGAGIGTGSAGIVVLGTPSFSTITNDANCYTGGALVASSCTIAAASVNSAGAVLVGFSVTGQTATLPAPTITTPGRVIYVTAANSSSDFTLSVNGGGTGNEISMRENTTATMIWNGSAWTAAGASSSTTLQAAYDNTLESAGGAELVVDKTSNTDGLTIRDSTVNPVDGALLSVQTASAAGLLSVNDEVTEYSSDGGAETAGGTSSTFPTSTWALVGSANVTRYTTTGNFVDTGQASVSVVTTAHANDGVKDTLSTTLTANQNYNVSFAARLTSGTFTTMNVYFSVDGTTQSVACTTGQDVTISVWTKVNCSFAAPASGITSSNAILIQQSDATVRTFYVDNLSVTIAADYNYATDGGVDNAGSFTTNWPEVCNGATCPTVSRSSTVGNDASDSAQVITTGTNQGIANVLSIDPLPSTLYRITVYSASTTTGFNSFTVQYTPDGGTTFVGCADYNTQSVSSSLTAFTEITCYITTGATTVTNPKVYFTQTDSTGRTFYVDTFSMTLSGSSTPNVQIGGGTNGGPVTLLTLDSAASAPIADNNSAYLGSMYYDTTLGELQCYESSGWGSCGASPDDIVTISPEYTNAVLHGTGIGTMSSDICSGTLHINDGTSSQPTICASTETYNFYHWTSPQATAQTYSIYVTYQLPNTFKSFLSGQTSIMGRTDSSNSTVQYSVYLNSSSGLTQCGTTVPVSTGSVSSWQIGVATGAADPSTCGFAAGNSIVFKIDVTASQNANAYVSNLNFTFSNK